MSLPAVIPPLFMALGQRAVQAPQAPALIGETLVLSAAELLHEVETLAAGLRARGIRRLALHGDNAPAWIVADLACALAGILCIPLPRFFSKSQLRHGLDSSGAEALLTDTADGITDAPDLDAPGEAIVVAGARWFLQLRMSTAPHVAAATQKITYTSGTTGTPKGVCLALGSLTTVAQSLAQASGMSAHDRHLCVLPLSTLLENLGVYAALLGGASIVVPSQSAVGMHGAAGLDAQRFVAALREQRATTAILAPQLLLGLISAGESGVPLPETLRFVAVGGAPLAGGLAARAAALRLPVFEGYGLSECASVLALNTPQAQRVGSVGQPLPHVQLKFAADGEILARGAGFLGYVGDPPRGKADWVATGDLGHLDDQGFLHLDGRKKSLFITAFGRNVAPEWIESELTQHAAIAQAAVFGEARPFNVAVLTPRRDDADIEAALAAVNATLPDYARIRRWLRSTTPFSAASGELTDNGRIRRAAISAHYAAAIHALYQETEA